MPAENSITREQATILASVLHELRPHWSVNAIVTLIRKNLATIPDYPSLVLAAVTVALDESKETPAIIFMDGAHWHRAYPKRRPPEGPPCEDHPEQTGHTCRCCHADVKTGIRPQTHIRIHYEIQETT